MRELPIKVLPTVQIYDDDFQAGYYLFYVPEEVSYLLKVIGTKGDKITWEYNNRKNKLRRISVDFATFKVVRIGERCFQLDEEEAALCTIMGEKLYAETFIGN